MAQVTLRIAGREHSIACRDGEEAHLQRLAAILDAHAETATRASGGLNGERTMLFIALILADQIDEMRRNPAQGLPPELLDRIAERLEAVAGALEEDHKAN
ncbi:cell division protein ZapA [Sphingomonas canadensis]|uniref:Cell division protein ZapA n=1 Tax=Sphingomonas canadensis TaxID=1219257 RepID=A0ABW3HCM0_9SPHN|nr:cell division protein ZapA [Sphingomonas canadensis]MCW3836787.1 cell division protein ZapA [Sphingomonas canadensis]